MRRRRRYGDDFRGGPIPAPWGGFFPPTTWGGGVFYGLEAGGSLAPFEPIGFAPYGDEYEIRLGGYDREFRPERRHTPDVPFRGREGGLRPPRDDRPGAFGRRGPRPGRHRAAGQGRDPGAAQHEGRSAPEDRRYGERRDDPFHPRRR